MGSSSSFFKQLVYAWWQWTVYTEIVLVTLGQLFRRTRLFVFSATDCLDCLGGHGLVAEGSIVVAVEFWHGVVSRNHNPHQPAPWWPSQLLLPDPLQ